jgi:hypothetical protein
MTRPFRIPGVGIGRRLDARDGLIVWQPYPFEVDGILYQYARRRIPWSNPMISIKTDLDDDSWMYEGCAARWPTPFPSEDITRWSTPFPDITEGR